MKRSLSSTQTVAFEDLSGAPEWAGKMLAASNEFQEQATASLSRPLLQGAIETYDLVHGVEKEIKCPLGKVPLGVDPIRCRGLTVDAAGKFTGLYYVLGLERLDWRPLRSGAVGVTAYYDLSHTRECRIKTCSAVQLIPHGATTTITGWDTLSFSRGTTITDDGSIFTFAEAGTYQASLQVPFASATYTAGDIYFTIAGAVNDEVYLAAPFTDGPFLNLTSVFRVTAGQTLTAGAYHTNAAVAARNVVARRRIEIHRLWNDSAPKGRVTLRFDGGT